MSWVTVGHFSLPYEAHLGRARLESEGIEALVADEHTINMQWMLSDALGGVRLQVNDEDQGRARAILAEDRSDLIADDAESTSSASLAEADSLRLSPLATPRRKRGFLLTLLAFFIGS